MPAWLQPIRISRSPSAILLWPLRVIERSLLALALFCSFASLGAAATPAGTIVSNQAETMITTHSGVRRTFFSNVDRFEVLMPEPPPSTANSGFYRFDQSGDAEGGWLPARYLDPTGVFQPVANVPASMLERAPLSSHFSRAETFHAGELIQLRVFDRDQNFYVTDVETITVRVTSESGEMEILELTETGKDTGIFTGFITITQASTVAAQDGNITARPNSHLSLSYVDPNDARDRVVSDILVDPYGLVFDSSTGQPISGVAITIVDDATGQPAEVFGVDGVSRYPSTVVTGDIVRDASGATYELEPGSYVFPFVRPGRYRYALKLDAKAGFTFPSTATPQQLANIPGAPFALVAASTGGAFDVVLVPVKVDIPLDAAETALALSMSTPTSSAGIGDFVRYDLELTSRRSLLPFRNVVLTNHLPPGFRLEEKSLRADGLPTTLQFSPDGRTFTLQVPELAGGQTVRISYLARIAAARHGRAVNTAVASAGRIRSTEASASVFVQDDLMATRAHVLGRVARCENGRPTGDGIPGVAVYLETGAMVVTDARGFFHFEGLHPGTHVVQLDTTTLPDGARAILPRDSTENSGRPWSRFVDVAAGSLWTADFCVETTLPKTQEATSTAVATTPLAAVHDQDWIDLEPETFDWLLPNAATPLPTPAVKLLVKHHPGHRVRAVLNGEPVNPINFEGTLRSNRRAVAASLWRGVMLREGENTIEIVREDSFGIERGRETRVIRYAAPPVRAELVATASTLVADGLTAPTIAVRLYDRRDNPARAGITGRYVVHPPFAAWREEKTDILLTPGAVQPAAQFIVGEDGIALIKLQPVTESGTVRVSLELADGAQEVRADLQGSREDWLVVGIAEGSPAWNTISGNLEHAAAEEIEKGLDEEGRVAFFAKGRIKGGWLLTAAYDSAKEKPQLSQRLHGLIESDAYYTVYGDDSQRYENAPSSRKLYVKLERKAVVALFGDYSLDWSSSSFTTYTRELHGAKVEYRGQKLRASVFQSDAGLTHGRDEFRGSGLSGPYVLTRRPLVAFSERVIVQERDRLRPDIVLLETPLSRNVDYAIDYVGGIVRLSQPLFPSSSELNPQYLVVHYEMEDQTAGTVEGARVEYAPGDRLSVGASHVRQSQDGRTDSVSGLDARVQLTKQLQLTAEAARSDNAQGSSDAYRAELAHATEKTSTRVYYREVGAGFGLDQLSEAQLGNRQIGLEGSQQLTTTLAARELLYQETVLPSGDQRNAGEAQLEWTRGDWSFRSGLRSAQDTRNGETQSSHLLTAGVSRRFFNERLELRADREQSIAGEAENLDFPTRTVLGARYLVTAKTSLIAEQEWTEARSRRTTVSRLGAKTAPWKGGALTGSVAQSFGEFPSTSLGSGLNQVIELSPKLSVEGGLERSAVLSEASGGNGGGAGASGFSSSSLHSSSGFSSAGQGDSTSVFGGVHWKPRNVLYNARVEFNDMQGSQRTSALASAQTEAGRNLGLVASVIAAEQTSDIGGSSFMLDARLGAAWRPSEGSTIILQRLDFVHVPGAGASSTAAGWKVIENLHVNQRLGSRWQISGHLGAKYVLAGLGGYSAESLTTLGALEARLNLTPKWDIGLNAAALSGWGLDTHQWSAGLSVGRTLATNLWVSVGYNYRGFVDTDFTAARYTAPGVYMRLRLKFDQESLAGLINLIKAE
jgi:hypothetical protein